MTHVRVNFHCRVIIHVRMHVNFTRGNKIYRGKDARKKKLNLAQLLRLRATFHTLTLFYLRV